MKNKNIFFLLLFFISIYFLIHKLPFPGIDDLFFKEPGIRLLRGLGFSVPSATGCFPGIEKLLAQYPAVYPFIFGTWFLVFGLSMSSSLSLSFLICAAIAFIQALLFREVLGKRLPGYIYGLIFFSWTIATGAIHRPDPLLTLLGLSLLLIIIQKASKKATFLTQLIIVLLMGLSMGTSPALGALLMVYMFFVLISIKGFRVQTIKTFSIWCSLGVVLCALIWWATLRSAPHLFMDQVIRAGLEDMDARALLEGIKFSFRYGNSLFYVPLIAYLTLLFAAGTFLEKNKQKRNFLLWQFLGVIFVWISLMIKLPGKFTYRQAFFAFFVFICGVAAVKFFESVRNIYLKKVLIFILFFCIGISYLPFFRGLALPLTWEKQDTYAYNKELILNNVPKGSKVLTDVRFWYIFDKDYEIYDLYFGSFNIYICDYVLLVSGGSGKPEVAPLYFFSGERDVPYFHKNFTKQLSTMSNQPNRLFGLPISRSRWCYRFQLYKRRTANNANFPNSF